jgi:L-idonate 5-dehydrogenase
MRRPETCVSIANPGSTAVRSVIIHGPRDLRIEASPVERPGAGQVAIGIERGGICGSDLHYFHDGGFGTVRLREPMILGHEVAGRVIELGPGVTSLAVGNLVAVSPSRPCGDCRFCHAGQHNHCLNMRFYGSAMPFPHIQGAFRQHLVADARQCARADGLSPGEAAMAEPLAVCLHAMGQAGPLLGKAVLVSGFGPIGALSLLCARRAGAALIVATDLTDETLAVAARLGADEALNVASEPTALEKYGAEKGRFDVVFECSGSAAAIGAGIAALRPGGTMVQLGIGGGEMAVPMMALTAKEISLKGSFRFHDEFFTGVSLMQKGLIDVSPLITHTFPLEQAMQAFQIAGDRSVAMKTQIAFS